MALFKKQKNTPRADLECLPRHIAIIMDGNGRWAQKRNLPRTAAVCHEPPVMRPEPKRFARWRLMQRTSAWSI